PPHDEPLLQDEPLSDDELHDELLSDDEPASLQLPVTSTAVELELNQDDERSSRSGMLESTERESLPTVTASRPAQASVASEASAPVPTSVPEVSTTWMAGEAQ